MRVPSEYSNAADAQVVVRVEGGVTGKIEASSKLSQIPFGRVAQNGDLGPDVAGVVGVYGYRLLGVVLLTGMLALLFIRDKMRQSRERRGILAGRPRW